MLQSDGSYAPIPAAQSEVVPATGTTTARAPGTAPAAGAQRNDPEADQALDEQREQQSGQGATGSPAGLPPTTSAEDKGDQQRQPLAQQPAMNQGGYPPPAASANGYPVAGAGGYPQSGQYPPPQGQYPQQGYPQQGGYGQYPPPQQQPYGYGAQAGRPVWGGQVGGEVVMVPAETLVRVRVNQVVSSNHSVPGSTFDGIVVNDVVAGGFVAIPRGATVQGRVLDAKASGALSGRGELSIQLTQVTLAGKVYPIVTEAWAHNGGDKTIETINKTAGFGALGAIVGAVAGGGVGAAVGGGIGAAAGLGSSATSGRGQVIIPSEGVVAFHLSQPAQVQTVSEQEMARLAMGVAPGADPRYLQRRPYYPPVGYYSGGGYPPYGYPRY